MSKKILIIGPIPPEYGGDSFGGIATHIEGLAIELEKKGYKVTIWNYKLQKDEFFKNIHILGNSILSYIGLPFYVIKTLFNRKEYLSFTQNILLYYKKKRLKSILATTNFDVIHIHSIHETAALAIGEITNNKIRVIATDHGFWQSKNFSFQRKKQLIKLGQITKFVDKIIYISNFSYKKHMQYDFNQQNKLFKIHNPIYIGSQKLKIKNTKAVKHTIFFNGLSETIKRKRFDMLLNAIQSNDFLKSNIKVIAIINPKGKEFLNNNVFDFEIETYGAIPMSKVNELYEASDLMVVPSKSESFGLVYIEALIKGVPIIGFDKVVEEFQQLLGCYIGEGFKSDESDHKKISEKIIKVLNHDIDYRLIQSKSAETFSWENQISEFENLYFKS